MIELNGGGVAESILVRSILLRLMGSVVVVAFVLTGCSSDPHDSRSYKALDRSRGDVLDAAKKLRSASRMRSQPSENYYGSFRPCAKKGVVHYDLETDWITPKGDEDDLRVFDYVANVLIADGWKDDERPSRRRRSMKRGSLEALIFVKPGASWIEGYISGGCYSVADAAGEFLNRKIDHLSG